HSCSINASRSPTFLRFSTPGRAFHSASSRLPLSRAACNSSLEATAPLKKLEPSAERLLGLLHRWRDEAVRTGKKITRIALAFEAGRDGFWLARWLRARGVEAHVIHASSVAVSREHRRAKTDRLDTELLKRGFLGWLRGERGHCTMARVPTIAEEDAKRPNRERECLVGARTLENRH